MRVLMIVGGAPRAGKGVISKRVLVEAQVPVLSLDVLKMGLHRAVPSVGVQPGAVPLDVGKRIWPLVRAMAENAVECEVDYVFEGDMLAPAQVVELRDLFGDQMRACFVGYKDISRTKKLEYVRAHTGLPNDWLSEHPDPYVLDVIDYGIDFSRWLHDECMELGVEYFDGSESFEAATDAAVRHLLYAG